MFGSEALAPPHHKPDTKLHKTYLRDYDVPKFQDRRKPSSRIREKTVHNERHLQKYIKPIHGLSDDASPSFIPIVAAMAHDSVEEDQALEEPLSPTVVSQLVRRVSSVAREPRPNVDPFDVHDPNWTLERNLTAAIERGNEEGTGTLSPHVTLAWKGVLVYGDDIASVIQQDATSIFTDLGSLRKFWRKPPEKTILHSIDGLLSPGEMLLVLGPPGSGCTTLLKVLTGQTDGYRRWLGSITFSGIPIQTMRKRFRNMMTFNGAIDCHFPYLTVSQTLEFAARTKTPHRRMNGISRRQYLETARDIMIATFGLKHAAETRVGNDFVRGVSGGERRRVSIAEMVGIHDLFHPWVLISA